MIIQLPKFKTNDKVYMWYEGYRKNTSNCVLCTVKFSSRHHNKYYYALECSSLLQGLELANIPESCLSKETSMPKDVKPIQSQQIQNTIGIFKNQK